MADNIVEFINTTGRTYDQLIAGVTVASTTASQQAVVKDVVLTNPNSRNLRLMVDGAVVAETSAATRFSGSELLGASESLVLTTGSIALLNRIRTFNSSSSFRDNLYPTQFSEFSTMTATSNNENSISSDLATSPYFAVFAQNGDFYYSNNSNSSLYRRAGGVNGSQSTITSNGCACSFDGRYIYSFREGTQSMSVTDTQNNGSVVTGNYTVATSGANTHTSANSAALDGYVWLKQEWSAGSGILINRETRVGVQIGGVGDPNNNRYFVGMGRNTAGDYFVLQTTSYISSSVYWWNLGSSLAAPSVKQSGGFSISGTERSDNNSNNMHRVPGSDKFLLIIPQAGSNIKVLDLDTIINNSAQTVSIGGNIPESSGRFLSITESFANADFGLTSVRATGILTTP
jgi:hypothetical protein